MTWSAPAAAASCAFSGLLTVVITVASAQRASWIAALPTAPGAALHQHGVPGQRARAEPVGQRLGDGQAAVRGEERDAERGAELEGRRRRRSRTACRAGTTVYSAAVPTARW